MRIMPVMTKLDDVEKTLIRCIECSEILSRCNCVWADIRDLHERLQTIEEKYITVEVLYSIRQTIETWQEGCETKINGLQDELRRVVYNVEQIENFIRIEDNIKLFNLPSVKECNLITENELLKQRVKDLENHQLNKVVDSELKKDSHACDAEKYLCPSYEYWHKSAQFWLNQANNFRVMVTNLQESRKHLIVQNMVLKKTIEVLEKELREHESYKQQGYQL